MKNKQKIISKKEYIKGYGAGYKKGSIKKVTKGDVNNYLSTYSTPNTRIKLIKENFYKKGWKEAEAEFAKERQRFEDECDDLRRQLEMKDFEFVKMLENADFGSYITSREGAVFDVSGFIKRELKAKLQEEK